MFCIKCFHPNTRIVNSRPHKKQASVWRRRKCDKCAYIFTTDERPVSNQLDVYVDGDTSPFSVGQLTISIARAFQHNPQAGKQQAHWLARTVELWLITEHNSVTPHDIEAVTHQTLLRFDRLAATQYAAQHSLLS